MYKRYNGLRGNSHVNPLSPPDVIDLGLSRGRSAMAIRQELVVAQKFLLFDEGMF
jgi:hypothetical protein